MRFQIVLSDISLLIHFIRRALLQSCFILSFLSPSLLYSTLHDILSVSLRPVSHETDQPTSECEENELCPRIRTLAYDDCWACGRQRLGILHPSHWNKENAENFRMWTQSNLSSVRPIRNEFFVFSINVTLTQSVLVNIFHY